MEHGHLPPCYAPLHRCLLSFWWVSLYCKGTVRRCNVAGSVNHPLYSNSQGALPQESTGFGPALLAPDTRKKPGRQACLPGFLHTLFQSCAPPRKRQLFPQSREVFRRHPLQPPGKHKGAVRKNYLFGGDGFLRRRRLQPGGLCFPRGAVRSARGQFHRGNKYGMIFLQDSRRCRPRYACMAACPSAQVRLLCACAKAGLPGGFPSACLCAGAPLAHSENSGQEDAV